MRRRLPYRYRKVALLTVENGVGEKTLAELTDSLGPMTDQSGQKSPMLGLRRRRPGTATDYAFRCPEPHPPSISKLGPGVSLEFKEVNLAHFNRFAESEQGNAKIRNGKWGSIARPPRMSDVWLSVAAEIQGVPDLFVDDF